jgi:hypothetical protein
MACRTLSARDASALGVLVEASPIPPPPTALEPVEPVELPLPLLLPLRLEGFLPLLSVVPSPEVLFNVALRFVELDEDAEWNFFSLDSSSLPIIPRDCGCGCDSDCDCDCADVSFSLPPWFTSVRGASRVSEAGLCARECAAVAASLAGKDAVVCTA